MTSRNLPAPPSRGPFVAEKAFCDQVFRVRRVALPNPHKLSYRAVQQRIAGEAAEVIGTNAISS